MNGHGHEATSQSDENALYLDLGSGYMDMYVSKNSLSVHFSCALCSMYVNTHTPLTKRQYCMLYLVPKTAPGLVVYCYRTNYPPNLAD